MFKLNIPASLIQRAAVQAAFEAEETVLDLQAQAAPPTVDDHKRVIAKQQLARRLALKGMN